jgi:hypothetical protein
VVVAPPLPPLPLAEDDLEVLPDDLPELPSLVAAEQPAAATPRAQVAAPASAADPLEITGGYSGSSIFDDVAQAREGGIEIGDLSGRPDEPVPVVNRDDLFERDANDLAATQESIDVDLELDEPKVKKA